MFQTTNQQCVFAHYKKVAQWGTTRLGYTQDQCCFTSEQPHLSSGVLKISNWWLVTTCHDHPHWQNGGQVWPPRVHHAPQQLHAFNNFNYSAAFSRSPTGDYIYSHHMSWPSALTEWWTSLTSSGSSCTAAIARIQQLQLLSGVLKISNWWLVTTCHDHPHWQNGGQVWPPRVHHAPQQLHAFNNFNYSAALSRSPTGD